MVVIKPIWQEASVRVLVALSKFQYGNPSWGVGPEYAAFVPAFQQLGHEVFHFDPWQPDRFVSFVDMNRALLTEVDEKRPDVMFCSQVYYEYWIETLDLIRTRYGVTTLNWNSDDSWKYAQVSKFLAPHYTAVTTTDERAYRRYHEDGIRNVLLTQWGARDEYLRRPKPADTCKYDVTFVGAAHGPRKRWIESLAGYGIRVTCFGRGWDTGPVDDKDIPEIMNDSVVSIGFADSRGSNQIKARTFEVPGAGGFLLTQRADGLDKYYNTGDEIVMFERVHDLATSIRYYLSHPQERDAIAEAGYRRTCSEYVYSKITSQALSFALSLAPSNVVDRQVGSDFMGAATQRHRMSPWLSVLRSMLVLLCSVLFGKTRGARAARRLVFEFSWRFQGARTFTASGLPGRMFYRESRQYRPE